MATADCLKQVASFVIIAGVIQTAIAEDNPAHFRGMVTVISTDSHNWRSHVELGRRNVPEICESLRLVCGGGL